ncbi:pseudouridine-5'-phosphate glycosidase [Iamia sp. SCSIO 61187]|uniref:pseudouridine-5'-phosphate glycosidase n=1 Tax=Iamia sp. SCSIO 61187 TaxID=2722752 RepID=UPI001C627CEF|nr:pseudouridine-5'-phosphate glycosidase [Iamia sp. SCSIO 61187]QYG94836.1 pseudouridine-5'-phosphate glycosidase [Iamia sp. SCSIO 61187]
MPGPASPDGLVVAPDVAEALASGAPVVALESTLISHGLPRPDNRDVAVRIEDTVRAAGAVPATIAVVEGQARIGLDDAALDVIATSDEVAKVSPRDLAVVAAQGGHGATTVAATAHLAARAGIALFATGGLGGVHRDASRTWDESADLPVLARTPITVVCAGVKSILDVAATLERMETLGIGVVGYGTSRFPAFYRPDSGFDLEWRCDTPEEVAAVIGARIALGTDTSALVVANPVKEEDALPQEMHDRVLGEGLDLAAKTDVRGKDVTPFLLAYFHQATAGLSLQVNIDLVLENATLAARIAAARAGGA